MQEELYIRVKQALAWLKRNQGIKQKDIADKMGMAEASFTRALARIKDKNDENFVISFHSAVSDYISLDYLLYGVGEMVVDKTKTTIANEAPSEQPANIPDMSSVFNAALAAKDDAIESLKRELHTKDDLIQSLRDQLATKDQLISEQKARLIDYRRIIDAQANSLTGYHYPIGAADENKPKTQRT